MSKLFIEDLEIRDKKVVMRVDFNVPLDGDGEITDASRLEATLPSIRYVLKEGGSLILMSHLGRPEGNFDPQLSLAPVAKFLAGVLKIPVKMAPDCIGHATKQLVETLKKGEVLLLENLRFHRAEEYPGENADFAKELASYGDCYVNDAFGCCHRKHSSVYTITQFFKGKAACGYLLAKEIEVLSSLLKTPKRPFHALIGGVKISSKLGVLKALLNHVDALLIGGAMSYTFLKALGKPIGNSLYEADLIPIAKEIVELAEAKKIAFLLPEDSVVAKQISETAETKVVETIPEGFMGLDVGPKTLQTYVSTLKKAHTILWNGPVGVFELDQFAKGTEELAKQIAASSATTVVGGGDSVAALTQLELQKEITHVSTGGGATLEFIQYGTLPAIEALSEKEVTNLSKSL